MTAIRRRPAPLGYVDAASITGVSGWVRSDVAGQQFFVVENGSERVADATLRARPDPDGAGPSGTGFEIETALQEQSLLSVGILGIDGERQLLPFATTDEFEMVVSGDGPPKEPSAPASEPAPASQAEPEAPLETESEPQPGEPEPAAPAELALPNPPGYIDFADNTRFGGWVFAQLRGLEFFAEIDGVRSSVRTKQYSRPDLIAQSIDAIGFEGIFEAESPFLLLKIGFYTAPDRSAWRYLDWSDSGKNALQLTDPFPANVVVSSADIAKLAGSLDADTELFLSMVQRFGHAVRNSGQVFDVLFIDGTNWSVSTRYRIMNVADGLHRLGYTTLFARLDQADLSAVMRLRSRIVVFFRAALDETYEMLVDGFRKQGSRIVYDVDDLIFDEQIISRVDGVRFLSHEDMAAYLRGIRNYRRFAMTADLVTTSTPYLSSYLSKSLGCKTLTVRNTIGKSYLKAYPADQASFVRHGDGFHIGYYSGSRTHQVDFNVAYPALVRFMRTYQDVVLRIVGMLDLDEFPDLLPLQSRIRTRPMLHYHEMIDDLAACDVIIAPLVAGDPYCESKSELKWFEAALRGRPCIASATETFTEAMSQQRFGLLAGSEAEWFDALSTLYLSPVRRQELAMGARQHVEATYSYETAGREAAVAYFGLDLPAPPTRATAAKPPRKGKATRPKRVLTSIGVVMPEVMVGGGGHRKIFKFCQEFAEAGVQVTLYVDSRENPDITRRKIRTHFYDFPCEVRTFRGTVDRHSAVICTHWSTAYRLRSYPEPDEVVYFVQDFEPMFDAVGSEYMRAQSTYTLGFHTVCYGQWVADRLKREFGIDPAVIPFSVDRSLYRPSLSRMKSVDVLFFARPSQPRRCFELGVEGLRAVYQSNSAVRIGLFGEENYGDLGFVYHSFGLVTNLQQLAQLYTSAHVGMCFSTTNPSLVGYEMLACGLPLIDVTSPGSEVNFGGDAFVYYSAATPEAIASSIAAALNQAEERARRRDAGLAYIDTLPPDAEFGRNVVEAVCDRLKATLP